jgi:drug/metabolite transporter (DMT)-like permease
MTVFAQSEMVLVPIWAFIVLAERPSASTLVGGTIIMSAVLGKAWLDYRFESRVGASPPDKLAVVS